MTNVLLTCVGRRNYLARYFREALDQAGTVVGTDVDSTAPGFVDCDVTYLVDSVYSDHYIDQVLKICREEKIGLLVSLNDLELPILARAQDRFVAAGVTLAVSSPEVIDRCFDKYKTFLWLRENGLPTPNTFVQLSAAEQAIERGEIEFPLIVKPRWGSASIGIFKVYDSAELKSAYKLSALQVKRSLLATASAEDQHQAILIQSIAPGTEFGCDVLNDFTGKTRFVVTKEKLLMRAGETDRAVIRNIAPLRDFCEQLGNLNGHVSNLDCDVFVDGDNFQILEMNPRFGGGYPFTHSGGVDFPSALVAWIEGKADVLADVGTLEYDQPYSKFDAVAKVGSVAS
ncbi:MAG: carbamoyl-phosphate synthase large subunit [Halioglobus sp.]|jgi:carbamoyl-phosphate synthase large subunit